jgi:tetratricopeptide (TPR) repeat protein
LQVVADALTVQYAHASHLPEEIRERALHLVSFALKLHNAWPQTRAILLGLSPWLEIQGYRHTWIDVLLQGTEMAQAFDDRHACARLHLHLGRLYLLLGEYATANAHLTESRQLAEQLGDVATLVDVLNRMAQAALRQTKFAEARGLTEAAFAYLEPDAPARMAGYLVLGRIAVHQAEWQAAIQHHQKALSLARQQGDPLFRARALRDLGTTYMMASHYDEALAVMNEAIDLFSAAQNPYEQAIVRMNLGTVYWHVSQFAHALACYDLCEPVLLRLGSRANVARLYNNRGLTYRELGRFDDAETAFTQAIQWSRLHGDRLETANILESLSVLHLRTGQIDSALTILHNALDELDHLPERPRHVHQLIMDRLREVEAMRGASTSEAP